MCSPSAPTPPDPVATAQAQAGINSQAIADTARYNQINQSSPFGSINYTGTIGNPDRTQVTSLSPELQQLLTGQIGISQGLTGLSQQRLAGIPQQGFQAAADPNGYMSGAGGTQMMGNQAQTQSLTNGPQAQAFNNNYGQVQQIGQDANPMLKYGYAQGDPLQTSYQTGQPLQYQLGDAGNVQRGIDYNQNINSGIDTSGVNGLNTDFGSLLDSSRNAAYDSQTQYLDPRFGREQHAMESQLAAQGIPVGSEAYSNAMAQFGETKNQAYQGAANAATQAGNSLEGQLFGQNLAASQTQFGQAQQQAQFGNQAQQQGYEQALGTGQFGNAAQEQYFGQLANRGNFYNSASQAETAQNQGLAQFGNQASLATDQRNQNQAQFYNSAAGQQVNQGMQWLNYNQGAQAQNFNQGLAANQAGNATNAQNYSQNMGTAQFNQGANAQNFDQSLQQLGYNQGAQNQNFNQGLQQGNYNQQEYQRQLSNQLQGRNQNFNELAAFLNGSPIAPNNPTFQPTTQYNPAQAAPDAVGLASSNYNAQSQARAAILGSIYGAAGRVGGAAAACWVAREVYGITNPDWLLFRQWLFERAPMWLRKLYLLHGPTVAVWLHDKPRVKVLVRHWMDARIAPLKAQADVSRETGAVRAQL